MLEVLETHLPIQLLPRMDVFFYQHNHSELKALEARYGFPRKKYSKNDILGEFITVGPKEIRKPHSCKPEKRKNEADGSKISKYESKISANVNAKERFSSATCIVM